MQRLFCFIEHIGRWRTLVQTRDISPNAVTYEKLSKDVRERIGGGGGGGSCDCPWHEYVEDITGVAYHAET